MPHTFSPASIYPAQVQRFGDGAVVITLPDRRRRSIRLTRALQTNGQCSRAFPSNRYAHQNRVHEALAEVTPKVRLDDIVLNEQTRQNIDHFIQEQHSARLLRAQGLDPRHRVMLGGAAGKR